MKRGMATWRGVKSPGSNASSKSRHRTPTPLKSEQVIVDARAGDKSIDFNAINGGGKLFRARHASSITRRARRASIRKLKLRLTQAA